MTRSRRDDLEICMEILELIHASVNQVTITDIIQHSRIKHTKAKQLLESMERSKWIEPVISTNEDLRFKDFYTILPEGVEMINVYHEKIKQIFSFMAESKENKELK